MLCNVMRSFVCFELVCVGGFGVSVWCVCFVSRAVVLLCLCCFVCCVVVLLV